MRRPADLWPGRTRAPVPEPADPMRGNPLRGNGRTLHTAQVAVPHGSIVVYTAITGDYDRLKEQPATATEGADCVAFLDEPRRSKTWRSQAIHTEFPDPGRNAKIHKILPHMYFPEARYSLWIDGSVRMRFPYSIRRLIQLYLADCDLAVFPHRNRTCVYQEGIVCLQRRLDDSELIWRQICRYTQEGYPPNAGLAECTVVLQRPTATVKAFNEAWWDEITRGSKRDQLSFPYAARTVGLRYGTFPGTLPDTPLFQRHRHTTPLVSVAARAVGRALDRHVAGLSAIARAALISFLSTLGRRSHGVPLWRRRLIAALTSGSARNLARRSRLAERIGRLLTPAPDGHPARPIGSGPPRPAPGRSPDRSPTPVRGSGPRVVGFGPVRDVPSWGWIGFDTARELSKYYDVVIYDSWLTPLDCDVLFVVKQRPPKRFMSDAQRRRTKIVYCPLDAYRDHDHLARDADVLRACEMVVLHSERLLPLVRSYCDNTHFVEHHTRYALNAMADYKDTGFILWVGGYQNVPYLLRWLERHPIEHELKILTDVDNHWGRHQARLFAAEIGMRLKISRDATSIAGYPMYPWSERRQSEMMRDCRAGLDIKLTENFNQYHKPPTKAQQFVASGIPFAVNSESYSAEYFRVRGFEIASPVETTRWLSREYWEATRVCGERLRASTSIETVGARYRELIEALWARGG